MRRYIKNPDKNASTVISYANGKRKVRYFHLCCDICGIRHPEVCVNELCEEEGFPEGFYCWNCQMSMIAQGFVKS
ncbi:MAG: hypothetical protein ABIA56_05225 [Actinomycetota bacterium]